MSMDFQPKLAWLGCGALALKDKIGRCDKLPGGLYKRQIGEHWNIVFNGTPNVSPKDDDHPELPPFTVYVRFNGWPAGLIDPREGVIAAGEAANEDSFIAAIEAELGCSIDDVVSRKQH